MKIEKMKREDVTGLADDLARAYNANFDYYEAIIGSLTLFEKMGKKDLAEKMLESIKTQERFCKAIFNFAKTSARFEKGREATKALLMDMKDVHGKWKSEMDRLAAQRERLFAECEAHRIFHERNFRG